MSILVYMCLLLNTNLHFFWACMLKFSGSYHIMHMFHFNRAMWHGIYLRQKLDGRLLIWNFKFHTISVDCVYHFVLLPVVYECSIALASFLVVILILFILTDIWWYHIVDLLYICLMADKVEHLFICLSPFGYLPLKFLVFGPCLLDYLALLYSVVWILCIFTLLTQKML